MAVLSITIPSGIATEVGNFIALARGYTGFLPDGVTAETKIDFVKRTTINQLKEWAAVGKRIEAELAINEASYRDSLAIT